MEYFNAFLCGGILCLIGQLLIDKTPLTPAKILVLYVVTGVVLGGAGVYQKLVDWAGSGATVPLTGFGYLLAKGGAQGSGGAGLPGGPHRGCHRSGGRHHRRHLLRLPGGAALQVQAQELIPPLWELFSSEQDFSGFFSTCVLHWARGDKHGAAI